MGKRPAKKPSGKDNPMVCLVDPFDNVRNVQRMILTEQGYDVEIATSLDQAAELWALKAYPVVVMEYFFPVEKTLSFIRFLKGQKPPAYLLLSTSTIIDDETCKELFLAGLDNILVKPYGREIFSALIKKGLERQDLNIKSPEKEKKADTSSLPTDILGVLDPYYFSRFIRREIKKARRHQEPLSLILVKLPEKSFLGQGFAPFYNELTGLLRNSLREEDLIGRENGHLGIVLEKTDETGSQILGKRLVALIQNHPSFHSDASWENAIKNLTFQYYTYPNPSNVPNVVKNLLKEIETNVRFQ